MKTICYVDGYNLYYGCLRHTGYKWLDLGTLLKRIVHVQDPSSKIGAIKYFTAPVLTKFATHGVHAQTAQDTYHRALKHHSQIQIINGYYSNTLAEGLCYINPPDKSKRVNIWKLEEKQTDVNLALAAYRDVAKGNAEQVIFVTNDTDLEPALRAIREDFGASIRIGIILPIRENDGSSGQRRNPNRRLSSLADWTRSALKEEELASSQLPPIIPTNKKAIRKPGYW